MIRVARFMILLACLVLAACQPAAPTQTPLTATATKTLWPTRTSTATPVPPTATPSPTITPVYPTPTLSFIFTALDTSTWLEFASPKYNFAFYYPPDWTLTLDENEESDTYQHLIWILPDEQQPKALVTIGFSGLDEHICVERVGGGSGELVVHGKISVLGQSITRELLVWDGKYLAVLYNGAAELRRHELVLTLALEFLGEYSDQESLTEEQILIADQIMASIRWIEAPTATATITPTITATPTSTVTPTRDPSITVTVTPTLDPSITVTATPTLTNTTSAYP